MTSFLQYLFVHLRDERLSEDLDGGEPLRRLARQRLTVLRVLLPRGVVQLPRPPEVALKVNNVLT